VSHARIIGLVGAVGVVLFSLLGGEYSILDWLTLRSAVAEERAALVELQAEIDSLTTLVRELETSAAAQERAAREEFGMIREGEILYRLVPAQ
jgi:cell division protein FtsB